MNVINSFDPLAKKYLQIFLILFLLATTIFLSVYKIASIPPALEQDETAIGYNAYSILETGKDEWGVSYPLYFKSFGDYKLPVYIYTVALFEKFIGVNEYAVRLPSAIAGIVAVMLVFLLMRHLTKNFTLSFITALALTLNPQHLHFSRAAFEVNMALTLALAGIYLFILAVDRKKLLFLFLSLAAFSLSLYSYNVTRLLSPLILIGISWLYWKKLTQFGIRKLIYVLLFLVVTLIPFLLSFFSSAGVASATSSLITGTDTLAKGVEMRSYLASLPSLLVKVLYNKYIYLIFQYFQNLIAIVSGSFFFLSGTTHPNQGIGNVGVFYLFDLPFFIIGLSSYYLKKFKAYHFVAFFLLVSFLTLALSKEVPHTTRGYFLVIPVVIFSSLGLFSFIYYLHTSSNRWLKIALGVFAGLFIFYNIQFYFASYYFRFPYTYARQWQWQNKELATYLSKQEAKYQKIIIDDSGDFVYTSLLFYHAYPPQKFMDEVTRYNKGLLFMARSWGKYEVRRISWDKDIWLKHTLLVTPQQNQPFVKPIHAYIHFPTTQIVLSVNNQLAQYPQTDLAYYILETDKIPKPKKNAFI